MLNDLYGKRHKDPAMGVLGYERNKADFYPTPPSCTEALLRNVEIRGGVWEPACGDGAISQVLVRYFPHVVSTDLHNRGYGEGGRDFLLETSMPVGTHSIVTNPPYTQAEKFIRHALDLTEPHQGVVAMLLRNEYDCARSRSDLFRGHPACRMKLILTKRPRWIAGTKGSPRHNYAWWVWDWRTDGRPPLMGWDD
jgi:hypothetical protein